MAPHSVPEWIWIKGSYLSQWLPQGERGDPLRSQNLNELKSSTVGPNLLNDFWRSKIFKKFWSQNHDELKSSTVGPNLLNDFWKSKFFFASQYIKNWTKVVPWKFFFVPEKKFKKKLLVGPTVEDFNSSWFWLLRGSPFTLW